MPALLEIDELRRELREKFPAAHRPAPLPEEPQTAFNLTFERGSINEVVSSQPNQGMALFISELLSQECDLPLALIDGRDSFDPGSHGNLKCRQLFWIRCREISQAIQCSDLLLRDGNLPLVLLDLHLTPARELKRLPMSTWHRLRNQAHESGTTLLALTPQPLLPSVKQRLTLTGNFSLDHLERQSPRLQFQEKSRAQRTAL